MEINLLNSEAFGNMAFEQMHETYLTVRGERKKTLEKLRNEAINQVKAELMKEDHWWKVSNFSGYFLGYGYGNAEAVANQFVVADYKDYSDELWVELIEGGNAPKQICSEKKYKVLIKMNYSWNIKAFQNLEKELENKDLTLPKID